MHRQRQADYDILLDSFGARSKPQRDSIAFLVGKGNTVGQAKTAVYRYLHWGGAERATIRRPQEEWNRILDSLDPDRTRTRQELISDLVDRHGATYPQANSAVYFSGRR